MNRVIEVILCAKYLIPIHISIWVRQLVASYEVVPDLMLLCHIEKIVPVTAFYRWICIRVIATTIYLNACFFSVGLVMTSPLLFMVVG